MFKKIILIVIVIVIIGGLGYWIYQSTKKIQPPAPTPENKVTFDPLNAIYKIEGEDFTLINGNSEKEIAPGSATKIEVMSWGEPAIGDLNTDGTDDASLFLTYSGGGSGTFYYVVAALKDHKTNKAIGTNAILLGDRIAPENISIEKDVIVINYATRKKDESMATPPSFGVTKRFVVKGGILYATVSEDPNIEKFNEYFTEVYLAKLPVGSQFDPFKIIKTTTFAAGEQFCVSLTMKKDIPAGSLAIAVYDTEIGQDNQQKSSFPQVLQQGNSTGCEGLRQSAGKYEYKIYIDNVLVAVIPFEVK